MATSDTDTSVLYFAAISPQDEFIGLLQEADGALTVRAEGNWITIGLDNTFFNGASIVPLEDDVVDFFDKLESKRTEPTTKQIMAYAKKSEEVEE